MMRHLRHPTIHAQCSADSKCLRELMYHYRFCSSLRAQMLNRPQRAITLLKENGWTHLVSVGRGFEAFLPFVAITDTDVMERNALVALFPTIILLICRFHIRQSWRNHRNRCLKGTSPLMMLLKRRMKDVEDQLLATTSRQAALDIIAEEESVLETASSTADEQSRKVFDSARTHLLDYLRDW